MGDTGSVRIIRHDDVAAALDMTSCIEAVERALTAYSAGRAELPAVIQLDVPEHGGEIHIKAGHLHGEPAYAVKIVSGFPANPERGLPANDGVVLVFDAATGAPAALILDRGLITDLRTGQALGAGTPARGGDDRNRWTGPPPDRRARTRALLPGGPRLGPPPGPRRRRRG